MLIFVTCAVCTDSA